MYLSSWSACLAYTEPLVQSRHHIKLALEAKAYNPSTQELEARRYQV